MACWNRTPEGKRARIAELIARDGPACWLCSRPIAKDSKKPGRRASLEHLVARSRGGGDTLDNLVLCHASCNTHLGERPVEQKWKMREKWHRALRSASRDG
jgi:5-methylcytosine-specific restriction endonuclease McrA